MGTIMKGLMDVADIKLNDQIIAISTDLAIKSAANAYLLASFNAVTPEVSELCSDFVNQKLTAHRSLSALILKNDWAQPYASPEEQMTHAYKQSEWVLNQNHD